MVAEPMRKFGTNEVQDVKKAGAHLYLVSKWQIEPDAKEWSAHLAKMFVDRPHLTQIYP